MISHMFRCATFLFFIRKKNKENDWRGCGSSKTTATDGLVVIKKKKAT